PTSPVMGAARSVDARRPGFRLPPPPRDGPAARPGPSRARAWRRARSGSQGRRSPTWRGAPTMDLLVTNATLLDLESGERIEGSSVRVEGRRIVEVGRGERLRAGDEVTRIDAGGRTLLPGLIDAHVHAALTTMDLAAPGRRP